MASIKNKIAGILKASHQREQVVKYLLLLGVLLAYFGYLSYEYGFASGGIVALLTWSFFVLCTPIADAGFLLDFPVRLITGLRMVFCELIVWLLAFSINGAVLVFAEDAYEKTALMRLFHEILTTPWPYWGIVVLCCAGTFLSVIFGDEVLDVASHKDKKTYHQHGFKWRLLAILSFFGLIVAAYYHLIESLGVETIINDG